MELPITVERTVNPREMQRNGWQAILDSFAAYAEGSQEN